MRRGARRGQSTVEYLLVISVLSVAFALAMAVVYNGTANGTDDLAKSMARSLTTGGVQR